VNYLGKRPKILIIKPSSLGDIVHSLALLSALKDCYPEAEIHWVVASQFKGILEENPLIKKLWLIDTGRWRALSGALRAVSEVYKLSKGLKKEGFDIAIDLQGLLRSGIISYLSGAGVRVGLKGFKEAREGSWLFHTDRVFVGKGFVHAVDRYLKVAEFLGCKVGEVRFPIGEGSPYPVPKRYAVLVPGARWQSKRWPKRNFSELSRMLRDGLGLECLIVGTGSDIEMAQRISDASGGASISIAGKTSLKELIYVLRGAELVISTDSGPLHIADALGKRVFAIFGPTSPIRTGPYGKNSRVINSGLECSPCLKRKCKNPPPCMVAISPELLYNLIIDEIKKEGQS